MKWISVIRMALLVALLLPSGGGVAKQDAEQVKEKQQLDPQAAIEQAVENLAARQRFELRYRFTPELTLRWDIDHTRATKMQMAGQSQESSTRDRSTNVWKFTKVEPDGTFQFENTIESMMLWRKIGDEAPVMYDSSQPGGSVPVEFRDVDVVGRVVATITADPLGKILERKSEHKKSRLGVGEILLPLPAEAVAIGQTWSVPDQFPVTDEHGFVQNISLRLLHRLEKVVDGKAYISIRTEVLTPIDSDKVRSQLMQQMSSGFAVFDLQRGMVVYKELSWNERVQGFEGNDSLLTYIAKRTERLAADRQSVKAHAKSTTNQPVTVEIKPRTGRPIMRK